MLEHMENMQKLIPNIWCNRSAEAVAALYEEAFGAAGFEVRSVVEARYPETDLPEFQKEFAGQPVTINATIDGYLLTLINAGDEFRPSPGMSFMLNFDPLMFDADKDKARAALDTLWDKLSQGGTERMPLGEYPFSSHYGWVEDKFGVNWQLMLSNPEGDPRPFLMPAMMFDGPAQDRAEEAANLYVELFNHNNEQAAEARAEAENKNSAEVGNTFKYPERSGKAEAGALAFGEFRVGDQWFVVMDNGSGQDHGFGGVSLLVNCAGQEEIDFLWDSLIAEPEAEQCGWLKDKFGIAWQIVPANLDELMQRPDAFAHMMQMKKLVIADF